MAIQHIGVLYAFEATLRELANSTRQERQRRFVPKLDALKR